MGIYDQLRNPIALLIFLLTLLLPVFVGLVALRRTKSQSDFFLGGRAVGKFAVALSAVASGRSSWLVLGLSGMAFTLGTAAVWAAVGYITAELVQFIYIGRRLRRDTERFGSLTLLDYFESRFEDRQRLIRLVGSIVMIVFLTAYVAAQFTGAAKSLSTALEMPILWSLLISGVLTLIYMILGGYVAVVYNDVIRAIIMIIALVIFPAVGLTRIGGFSALVNGLSGLAPGLVDPFSISVGAAVGFLGIGLGSPGQPHIVVRYMSIDRPERLRSAAVIGTFWNVVLAWGAVFVGLVGRTLLASKEALPGKDPELVYLVLAADFFGPVLYGIVIGGIFAAILSTVDSQLLVVASAFVRDVYEKIMRRDVVLSEAKKLALSRWVVLLSGILAMVLAYVGQGLVFWLVPAFFLSGLAVVLVSLVSRPGSPRAIGD